MPGRLVCCKGCGRDTTNRSGYCWGCNCSYNSTRDKLKTVYDVIEEQQTPPPTVQEQYNGETERDDI